MTAIELLACAGLITGVFLILGLKPTEFTDGLFAFLIRPKGSIREDIRETSGRKKPGPLRREILEAQGVLEMTGRGKRFSLICAAAPSPSCWGIFSWPR